MSFLWSLFVVVFAIGVTVLWLVIGWRAMRAHEWLAESQASLAADVKKFVHAQVPPVSSVLQAAKVSELDPKVLPKFRD